MKKRRERRKHRAGCSKAEPKIFAPPQTPFPGAQVAGRPQFKTAGDGHYLHLQTQFGEIDARNFELSW